MSHPIDPNVIGSTSNASSSTSGTETISLAVIPPTDALTASDGVGPSASAGSPTSSDPTVVNIDKPFTPPPFIHNVLCPFPNSKLTSQGVCLHCTTFRWLDPGQGNLVRGPPDYWPVYSSPPGADQNEMPRLVHPLPVLNFGAPQSLKVNSQDSITKVSRAVRKIDEVRVQKSKDEIDTLLVVAGLFSAIQTAFIIESYKQLQSDPADMTNQLLIYLSQQLANSSIPAIPDFPSFATATPSIRINIFWFCGLVISLMTASFGILTKQWLREYLVHESSAEVHLRIRFFRIEGWEKWRASEIVAILPFLLQFSMLLFFLGLTEFLNPLNKDVDKAVKALVYLWASLVAAVTLAPILSPRCPWKTPLLNRPLHRIRDFLLHAYQGFYCWYQERYKVDWQWHPRNWFNDVTTWLRHSIASALEAITNSKNTTIALLTMIKELLLPPENCVYSLPRKREEEDCAGDRRHDINHFLGTYQLVQTDEHLSLVIGALGDSEYLLDETVKCLKGVHKLRKPSAKDDPSWPIGRPSSYGPSLVPSLIPLLIAKIQHHVSRSGSTTEDLETALPFLLDSYNEKFIDGQVLWPLVGGMLLDYHFTHVTVKAFVDRWEVIREVPRFPQLSQSESDSKTMIWNIFDAVLKLIKKYTDVSLQTSLSQYLTQPEPERKIFEKQIQIPGILLDVMLSIISYADIADIESQSDLFSHIISEFTRTVHLMITMNANVAVSLDLSIRRLNYLCHKLPSVTNGCSLLIKELEHQLLQYYLKNAKEGTSSFRQWQRNLGISPHWRQILERNGLIVTVDGVNDSGSGFEARPKQAIVSSTKS
ncbi:hypothetical protein QCA50_008924 [Cerrena zonata]|uniref:DUF6535 domain-containing protein n=1 Tax=Cerrena zonata TaxID=2478898 RepID=A0AAW0GCN8_9APHY